MTYEPARIGSFADSKEYLGIEIGSLLHQGANGKPEAVGQREIVTTGQGGMLAIEQCICIVWLLQSLVDTANAAGRVMMAVMAPAA